MLDATAQSPMIGHNQPDIAAAVRDNLAEQYPDATRRRDELLAAAARVPEVIADEGTAQRLGDFIKQMTAASKGCEKLRVAEKEPHLQAERAVDGFFGAIIAPLNKAKVTLERRLTLYLRLKADEERAARQETERAAREEADKKRREAEEAQRKLDEQAAAERRSKKSDEIVLADAVRTLGSYETAEADVIQAQKAVDVKPAELSRTRGEYGSVSSLRQYWDFTDLDRAALDLETLRQHLPQDALEKALRSFIKAGGREIAGARIFQNTHAAVR